MPKGRIVSDQGTHYFRERLHWSTGEVIPGKRQKVQRFLCVGGPLDKMYRSGEELAEEATHQYSSFNNAGSSNHSMIFVHKDLLS